MSKVEWNVVFQTFFRAIFVPPLQKQWASQTTQQVLARQNVQKTTFESAEMMLGLWNQQNPSITAKRLFRICVNKSSY